MKEIFKSEYSRFFIIGLILIIVCAWFSAGFNHEDEHFQVLEYCNYKLGSTPALALTWEYRYKMRAALLPWVAYCIARIMQVVRMYNPFILAFILRLLTGLTAWFITCKLCLLLTKEMKTEKGKKLLVIMSLFLWFVPYFNVRFSSENVSGILILYGLYFLFTNYHLQLSTVNPEINSGQAFQLSIYIPAGFLFGLSFFIRIQNIFAFAGLGAWLIFVKKAEWKYLLILCFSAIAAIGINIILDSMFYYEKVLTPFNYFYQNIVLHHADDAGILPWWFYVPEFIIKAIPPFSIILLFMFAAGVWKNLRNPLVWLIIPVIVLHSFISHKELRFLLPVMFIFIYITALGFDYFLAKPSYMKIHNYVFRASLVILIPALLYRIFASSEPCVMNYKYLYDNVTEKNTVLFSFRKDPDYNMACVMSYFYRNPAIRSVLIDSISQMAGYLKENNIPVALYLDKKGINFDDEIPGYKKEMVYTFIPSWLFKFNINNWENRSRVWSIYKFTRLP